MLSLHASGAMGLMEVSPGTLVILCPDVREIRGIIITITHNNPTDRSQLLPQRKNMATGGVSLALVPRITLKLVPDTDRG